MRIIKYSNIVIYLFATFILYSCANDDAPANDSEVSKAAGTYQLIELNVDPAQDINDDGTESTNLLDELSCISGTLVLRSDGSYSLNLTGIEVTSITNGEFFIACATPRNSSSNWNIQGGQVTLFADVTTTPYVLANDNLTRTLGENLPGIHSVVYEKQ